MVMSCREYSVLKHTMDILKLIPEIDKCWVEFFKGSDAPNLKKMVKYILSIPVINANVKHIFSMMKNLWTNKRNGLKHKLVKTERCVNVNYDQACSQFLLCLQARALLKLVKVNKNTQLRKTYKKAVRIVVMTN